MSTTVKTAKSDFKILSWQQQPCNEENARLTRADVQKRFQGEIAAESTAILLMYQAEGASAGYVATETIVGRIGERSGSFVIQHGGAVAGGILTDSFGYIIPDSATGELTGLRGHCTWHHDEHAATFTLTYELAVQQDRSDAQH